MIQKPFDQIDAADVEGLVTARAPEGPTLEYKQTLPGMLNQDKVELLADVSAFANAAGGDIVYGIEEQRDNDGKATGLPERIVGLGAINPQHEILRIQHVLNSLLDPAIPAVRWKDVSIPESGSVVILARIPRSFSAPHMVTIGDCTRFYIRIGAQKAQLDREGIRSAFLLPETARARLQRFRDERLSMLLAGQEPFPLLEGWRVVVHVIPRQALDPGFAVTLRHFDGPGAIPSIATAGVMVRNFDGIAFPDNYQAPHYEYTQLFRNGCVERAETGFGDRASQVKTPTLSPDRCEAQTMELLKKAILWYREIDLTPPVYVMLSLLNVRGEVFHTGGRFSLRLRCLDKPNLLFPEISIESFDGNRFAALQPIFDQLWQSGGFPRSFSPESIKRHQGE